MVDEGRSDDKRRPESGGGMSRKPDAEDREWVREAFIRFEGPLTLYAAKLLGDLDRARDVTQDAFVKLCVQDRTTIEGRLAEWLYTVVRNRALDVLRKEGRMANLGEDRAGSIVDDVPEPREILEREEIAERALKCLDRLPPGQQEVIRLKIQHGFSYKEISRISGRSVSSVGVLIHVGLKTIRAGLRAADLGTNVPKPIPEA